MSSLEQRGVLPGAARRRPTRRETIRCCHPWRFLSHALWRGCEASAQPWTTRARPISMSAHPARCLTEPCCRWNRRDGVRRRADLCSSCSRWRMRSAVTYRCMTMVLTTGHFAAGVRARASALARTTSGSRGSGARASYSGRSRRACGFWIRIRFTVCHLLRPVTVRAGLVGYPDRLVNRFFEERRRGRRDGRHPKVRAPVESFGASPGAPKCPPGWAGIASGSGRAGGLG